MIPGNLTPDQQTIREAIQRLMQPFSDAYWLERDETATFPHEFRQAVAAGGWLGIAMPEEYGGSGLGVAHAVVMMEAVANSAGAMSAASSVHLNIFGPQAIVKHGTPAQKAEWLPPIIAGDLVTCFGVTEPDAGLDTTRITTAARREGRRRLRDQRPQNLDLDRTTGAPRRVAGPHGGIRPGPSDRGPVAVLRRTGSPLCRDTGDPEDGPPRGQLEHGLL
jgi:hypothetical protein